MTVIFPVVYSEESIAAFTDNPSVIGIQKAVFMSIQDSYDGTLTTYYDYDDGTMGVKSFTIDELPKVSI